MADKHKHDETQYNEILKLYLDTNTHTQCPISNFNIIIIIVTSCIAFYNIRK